MPVVRIYCGNQRTQLNQHSDDDSYRPLSSHLTASTKPLLRHTSSFCCAHRRLVALGGSLVCSTARRLGRLHWRRFPGKVLTQRCISSFFPGGVPSPYDLHAYCVGVTLSLTQSINQSWRCRADVASATRYKLEKSQKSLKCNKTFKFLHVGCSLPRPNGDYVYVEFAVGPLTAEPPNAKTLNSLILST